MRNSCVRCWLAFVFSLDFCAAQPVVEAAKETAKQGFPVTPQVQVAGNVSVEAVLLPPNVTRGLFGRAVSDRYVAVQLIVSNRSDDAALIIHDTVADVRRINEFIEQPFRVL